MNNNNAVEHSIFQLLRSGSFGDIRIGMTRLEILRITGEPDAVSATRRRQPEDNQVLLFGDQGKVHLQLAISDGQLSGIWFYFRQSRDTSTLPEWSMRNDSNSVEPFVTTACQRIKMIPPRSSLPAGQRHASAIGTWPVVKVTKMLKRYLERIVTWFQHRITHATAEGFNSRIQSLKAAARGFRNFANYRTRILFFCGRLDMKSDFARKPAMKQREEPT